MEVEQRDTARDFAVHPPRKLLPLRVFEPLEDQIHPEEEPTILMFRVSVKEFKEWEAAILSKYGWLEMTDEIRTLLNGTSESYS